MFLGVLAPPAAITGPGVRAVSDQSVALQLLPPTSLRGRQSPELSSPEFTSIHLHELGKPVLVFVYEKHSSHLKNGDINTSLIVLRINNYV